MHFIVPPGLPVLMVLIYDLSPTLHAINGEAKILGCLGLILPGVTGVQTRLVPLAAAGLVLVMVGAMIYHIPRGETFYLVNNLFLAVAITLCGLPAASQMRWVGCEVTLSFIEGSFHADSRLS